MLAYSLRRLASAFLVIFLVLTAIFFVTQLLGDPVSLVLGDTATETQIRAVRERLRLNDPLWLQYWHFASNALRGSFGDSFWQQRPALEIVLDRLPASFLLAGAAMLFMTVVGVTLGIIAAYRQGSFVERLVNVLSIVSTSLVNFWLALMLILFFAVNLRWLPTSGYGRPEHLVLPVLTISMLQIGTLAQITRASMVEQLASEYVAAARARGLSPIRIMIRYAFRNALIPILTVAAGMLIALMSGAVITEVVFGWPGIGLLMLQAIRDGDLPLIQASIFVSACLLVVLTLLVDLAYTRLNPRVRIH